MAFYHVRVTVFSKGLRRDGSAGFARYIARARAEHATQSARYIGRESHPGKDDLVLKDQGRLPSWAHSASHFFAMADRYERSNATVARCYEIALPRELSPQDRLDLAQDIRCVYFAEFPHAFAVHNPVKGGVDYPHLHLMLSERRPTDTIERGPKQYFSRPAVSDQDPATHGVRKDRSFHGRERLQELRAGVALLTNAALERAGVQAAVSHASLKTRRYDREAAVYRRTAEKAQVEARREDLHRYHHPWETAEHLVVWQHQKAQDHITDISREAMVDRVRDRFWRNDQSPARVQERQASVWRSIQREHQRTGRAFQGPQRRIEGRTRGQTRPRVDLLQVAASIQRMRQSLERDEQVGSALRVRLWDREDEQHREHDRGLGW
jgi:MobA/MobL family